MEIPSRPKFRIGSLIMNPTATHINFFTCKRKLWLFSRNIKCEQESDFVKIGKIYHEDFEKENIEIDNIKIDKLKDGKVFEFKKKNNLLNALRRSRPLLKLLLLL